MAGRASDLGRQSKIDMFRKILIAFAILLLFVVTAGAFLYRYVHRGVQEAEGRVAAKQKMLKPHIISGEGNFEKRTFYTGEGLGNISQISVGWPADRERADIAVVGSQGADFIDSLGQMKKQVRFSIAQYSPVVLAQTGPSGEYGYLTRDESWAAPATLFDEQGHVSWHSKWSWQGVDDSAPGDVFGNGQLSVVIGFNGAGGLALYDGQGEKLWSKAEANVWHVEMLDTNGDGRDEILHSDAKGQLIVRNEKGEVISRYLPGTYVSFFSLTRWAGEPRPSHILIPVSEGSEGQEKPAYVLLNAKGDKIMEMDSPLGNLFTRLSATPIRFGKGTRVFAVLENDSPSDRSMLMLYAQNGQILYQEILGESCLGVAALPTAKGERLLVGCDSKILEYSPMLPSNTSVTRNSRESINALEATPKS
jgi:hypothetical protein